MRPAQAAASTGLPEAAWPATSQAEGGGASPEVAASAGARAGPRRDRGPNRQAAGGSAAMTVDGDRFTSGGGAARNPGLSSEQPPQAYPRPPHGSRGPIEQPLGPTELAGEDRQAEPNHYDAGARHRDDDEGHAEYEDCEP